MRNLYLSRTVSWSATSSNAQLYAIPGPKILPIIGTVWTYFPLIGGDDPLKPHLKYLRNYQKYGKIILEKLGGKNIVSVYDPKDIETVFLNEGKWPTRISHEVLLQCRKDNPELYSNGGLVPTNGPKWGHIRKAFQKDINRPSAIELYLPKLDETSREFVDFLEKTLSSQGITQDLLTKMHQWALENVGVTVLDTRLNAFGSNDADQKRSLTVINVAKELLMHLSEVELGLPIWKLVKTPTYRLILEKDLFFYRLAENYVSRKLEDVKNFSAEGTILEKYLAIPGFDKRDVIVTVSDLVFTGLLTTAISMSFVLYHLSRNLDKQDKLFREILGQMKSRDDLLTVNMLNRLPYLKACVKETLRLNPVSLGTGRVLNCDVLLSGHLVPANTIIITQNQVASILPEFVDAPLRYEPERWLRDTSRSKKLHPYLVLPFGSGPRSCIGRRFAELEMHTFLARIIRKFRLVWRGSKEVGVCNHLLNIPDAPMDISMIEREE